MSGGVAPVTPLPWALSMPLKGPNGEYNLFEIHWSDEGECIAEIVHGEEDATYLVHAANCHPDLVEALEAVRNMNRRSITGSEARKVWAKVDAALAKAREGGGE